MVAVNFAWTDTTGTSQYREIWSPGIEIDTDTGVLFLQLMQSEGVVNSELDDEEIFVFTDQGTGKVTGFTIPHYLSYWNEHQIELVDHLASYAPDLRQLLGSLIFGAESSTASEVYERQYG